MTYARTATLAALFGLSAAGAHAQAQDCSAVTADSFGLDGLELIGAEPVAAGTDLGRAGPAPADHCSVTARIGQHTGIDGNEYAITFNLRLPDDWNGDFYHQFNGGNDGNVVPATGDLKSGDRSQTALRRGYAVVSSDAGHDGRTHPDAGMAGASRFGFDPQARADYGYQAVAKLHPVALDMTEAYYGSAPEFVYGGGSSNGGRHAMVAAARMPDAFDGLLIGYPGFNLPRAAVQHALDVQALTAVTGDIRTAFSPDDMALLQSGILAACDGLDGLEDGFVQDMTACQGAFDVTALRCTEGQNADCLDTAQVTALQTIQAGPKDAEGNQLYSEWAWDPGMASGNYRLWKLESNVGPWDNYPRIVVLGAPSLAQVFTTPPTRVDGANDALLQYLLDFDLAEDAAAIHATDDTYTESAMDFMTPPGSDNPKLEAAQEAGTKLMIFHGAADPVFSVLDTVSWYEALDANNDGTAASFARLFVVPGMPHGAGGPSTDEMDFFTPLVDWVENGAAPDHVVAGVTARNQEGRATLGNVTRKLCAWPTVARYKGDDPAHAASFACE
ncbi:tannase/feruloyl esterase family alpha/beta hydrolase [Pseudoponticoccus marisrubri]|uniref:Feruloyl esterase n=1 Tax=Pseudoponticoccus marisrubri TaxID=1685382 RepID=A0A0W7WE27_9RHOB|nr:tannase/feruloyl esterase family alpha/beta hydrolase [Pseudoponticoccus marisrubri]KUF08718.1 feruloyl esterase [Pseudoponticoccus marisrubri]